MPNINPYEAPSGLGLNPTETGVESAAAAARRLGAYGSQIAEAKNQTGKLIASTITDAGQVAVNYEDHREISAGMMNGAKLLDNLDSAWNQTAKTSDPNDPSVRQKFLEEEVQPAIDKFKQGFNTEKSQAWADHYSQTVEDHLSVKTKADQSTMAGIAAQQNVTKTINTLSSTVRNDPTSLDTALKAVDTSVKAMVGTSPTLDATASAKLQAELGTQGKAAIVKSFLLGVAEKNPAEANRIIESGKYAEFIDGTEAKTIIGYARTNQRLADSEARNARVMTDYTARQDFHQAANQLELSTAPANPGDSPTLPNDYWQNVRKLGKMPGANLEPARLKSLIENGERITTRLGKPEPLAPVSHATTIDLLGKMRANDDTRMQNVDDIYKAYGDGKLNTADFNFLQKEFKESRSPEGDALSKDRQLFFKQYAGAIAGRAYDPVVGSPKLYSAEMDARRVESDLRSKGLDPHLAYDPSSEYFLGNPKRLAKYSGSMQTDLSDKAAAPASATKPEDTGPPASLRGIASLSYSPTRQLYRDDTTGKMYRKDGTEVTK